MSRHPRKRQVSTAATWRAPRLHISDNEGRTRPQPTTNLLVTFPRRQRGPVRRRRLSPTARALRGRSSGEVRVYDATGTLSPPKPPSNSPNAAKPVDIKQCERLGRRRRAAKDSSALRHPVRQRPCPVFGIRLTPAGIPLRRVFDGTVRPFFDARRELVISSSPGSFDLP